MAWLSIAKVSSKMGPYSLRIDISNAFCPLGCWRLAQLAVRHLSSFCDDREPYRKRIEILGAFDYEKDSLKTKTEDLGLIRKDDHSFVHTPGCTCSVSPYEFQSCMVSRAANGNF